MSQDRFRRVLQAGEVLFREGEPGHEAYAIETGLIEIYKQEGEARNIVARLGRDEIFGEMALVGDQTRSACAAAVEDTVLVIINHDYVSDRLHHADPLLRHLLRVTLERSRDTLRWSRSQGAAEHPPAPAQHAEPEPDREVALRRIRIEQALELALDNREFELHYQPVIRLSDGSVAGFEALIRWFRPSIGRVPPSEFIPIAEDCELIVRIGHWIVQTACADLGVLDTAHAQSGAPGPPPFLAINLSIRQFGDAELFPCIREALAAHALEPRRLKLEITESLVMNNLDKALDLLSRCKGFGLQLAIDDFGTGYSSLSYLHRFPVDTLKLDRSFIKEITHNEPSMKIVRAVASLATELSIDTVAEGIETADQAQMCRRIGIGYAQGFHYAAAMPCGEAAAYLRGRASGRKIA